MRGEIRQVVGVQYSGDNNERGVTESLVPAAYRRFLTKIDGWRRQQQGGGKLIKAIMGWSADEEPPCHFVLHREMIIMEFKETSIISVELKDRDKILGDSRNMKEISKLKR